MTLCEWTEVYVDKRVANIDGHEKLKPVLAQLLQLLNVLQIYNNQDAYMYISLRVSVCMCLYSRRRRNKFCVFCFYYIHKVQLLRIGSKLEVKTD